MSKPAFTEHPKFMSVCHVASAALVEVARLLDCDDMLDTLELEATTNRVVDDMTKLLLRAYDAKQSKSRAA